jgi:hypothetical protein
MSSDDLKRARMALAQVVTRSLADSYADHRAARTHRSAAATYLRRGGREDLAVRLDHDRDVTAAATRRTCRELMQLVDAEIETRAGFATAATDGGER